MNSILLPIDLFGYYQFIHYDKANSYRTRIGGIITLLLSGVLLYLSIIFLINLKDKSNPQISYYKEDVENSTINLTSTPIYFNIIPRFKNRSEYRISNISNLIELRSQIINGTDNTKIQISPCGSLSETDLTPYQNATNMAFKNFTRGNSFCIKYESNYTIGSMQYSAQGFTDNYFRVGFKINKNSSEFKNFDYFDIEYIIFTNSFKIKEYKAPVYWVTTKQRKFLDKNVSPFSETLTLKKAQISSFEDIFDKSDNYIFEATVVSEYQNKFDFNLEDNDFLFVVLLDSELQYYERIYTTIFDISSELAGVINIFQVLVIAMRILYQKFLYVDLMNFFYQNHNSERERNRIQLKTSINKSGFHNLENNSEIEKKEELIKKAETIEIFKEKHSFSKFIICPWKNGKSEEKYFNKILKVLDLKTLLRNIYKTKFLIESMILERKFQQEKDFGVQKDLRTTSNIIRENTISRYGDLEMSMIEQTPYSENSS
jgi:hypothetical protein